MALNPFEQPLADAIARLGALRTSLAKAEAALAYDFSVNASAATIANSQELIAEYKQLIAAQEAEVSRLRKLRDDVDKAALDRIAKGEDPTGAYNNATQQVQATNTVWAIVRVMAIIGVVVGALYGIRWLLRRLKKNR